jgi:hypothetical protein
VQPEKRKRRVQLGYDFSPTPRKLLEDFRDHQFEHATYVLLATLYDRADTQALLAGGMSSRQARDAPSLELVARRQSVAREAVAPTAGRQAHQLSDRGSAPIRMHLRVSAFLHVRFMSAMKSGSQTGAGMRRDLARVRMKGASPHGNLVCGRSHAGLRSCGL